MNSQRLYQWAGSLMRFYTERGGSGHMLLPSLTKKLSVIHTHFQWKAMCFSNWVSLVFLLHFPFYVHSKKNSSLNLPYTNLLHVPIPPRLHHPSSNICPLSLPHVTLLPTPLNSFLNNAFSKIKDAYISMEAGLSTGASAICHDPHCHCSRHGES